MEPTGALFCLLHFGRLKLHYFAQHRPARAALTNVNENKKEKEKKKKDPKAQEI